MLPRLLAEIEGGEVEPEAAHAPDQAAQGEHSGVLAPVVAQAALDQTQVGQEFVGRGIPGVIINPHAGPEPRRHQGQQIAIRHVGLTRPQASGGIRQTLPLVFDPRQHGRVETHHAQRLGQHRGQFGEIAAIGGQDLTALAGQGIGDGGSTDIGVAVHVAADPGTETQHIGQFVHRAIAVAQGALQLAVERRQHPIQGLDQVVTDLFQFVTDGRFLRRRECRLPRRGQRHPHPFEHPLALARGQVAVDVLDQTTGDLPFLFQQHAPGGFGGVGGEHRLDVQPGQQFGQPLGRHLLATKMAEHGLQSTRLG